MQAEGAAIAAAVFASVSRAEHDEAATGTQEPGQGLPPDGQADRPKPRARKPKKRTFPGAESEEDALRMKAEAARIAAEVFASVPQVSWSTAVKSQMAMDIYGCRQIMCGSFRSISHGRSSARLGERLSWLRGACQMRGSTLHMTNNKREAMVLQSMEEAGDAEQQAKPKKMKRRREAESPADPEEALRLKAEAARIAAEVFAGAELADIDGAPEQEHTKVSAPS